jgi:hypothetical protein
MDDIRKALLHNEKTKLSADEYLFVVKLEEKRLLKELIVYSVMSLLVGLILFFSLRGEINRWD